MTSYVGTSGFSYKEWKGSFYPEEIRPAEMLAYYAGRLGSVEINNTFYRIPRREVLEGWAAQVPESFRFVLKASRRITHFKRLKDAGGELDFVLGNAAAMGEKLGPLLFQLPPYLRKDGERLTAFLEQLPGGRRFAFEFRHPSWYDDETFAALRSKNAALVVADNGKNDDAPLQATADFGYLRLRQPGYGDDELAAWAERIRAQGWKDVFAFFKHEDEGAGPRMAARFRSALEAPA